MDKELEYIKLKVDWYKSVFPWILAMVVGAVTFAKSIDPNNGQSSVVLTLLLLSVVLLLGALLTSWFAALALIHRLEAPHKYKSGFLNFLLWQPHGPKSEMVFGTMTAVCLVGGLSTFVCALGIYAAKS